MTRPKRGGRTRRSLVLMGMLAIGLGTGGCTTGPRAASDDGEASAGRAPGAGRIAARSVGPIEFRAYDGPVARDARLAVAVDALAAVVQGAVNVTEERAGIAFVDGRRAAVLLVDGDVRPSGDVASRIVDGVRRSVIRIPAQRLLSGEFVPDTHFAALIVEAAVLADAGERIAPPWLRAGLAMEVGGAFDRVLHERVLGGATIRTRATDLFPSSPSGDDRLVAGTRVRALARIARGQRGLARFVTTRLAGTTDAQALRDVGVHDAEFLDAAAETERDRALASVALTGTLRLLSQAREALAAGEASRGIPIAALLGRQLDEGGVSPWVAADARIVLANYRLRAGDAAAARSLLDLALSEPSRVIRLREARLLEARAAAADGDSRASLSLYRRYATDFPGTVGTDEALRAIGVDRALAALLPGIVDAIASDDAAVRRGAAKRLAETGDPVAARPLRLLASDDDPDVRRIALSGLLLVLGDAAANELELGTFDPVPDVRGAALGMLVFADAARGEARARALAGDPDLAVKSVVERILGSIRAREDAERRDEEEDGTEPPPPSTDDGGGDSGG